MASKMEFEVELESSADKHWKAIGESNDLLPKIFPEQYKSIEFVEGDGKSIGSVRLLKYGEAIPIVTYANEKIEIVDEANKIVGTSVIDVELLNFYKVFKATIQVVPKGEGCTMKGSFEYEKASAEVPEPDSIKELTEKTFKELDAYLRKN